jgi:hypothetical protein
LCSALWFADDVQAEKIASSITSKMPILFC